MTEKAELNGVCQILDQAEHLMRRFRFTEAVTTLEQGLLLEPNNKDLLEQLVSCNIELKRPGGALHALDRITRLEPAAMTAWAEKGFLHLLLNENAEGIRAITNSLQINPRNGWLWLLLGMAFMAEENWERALESFERSLLLQPNSSVAWYNCAVCLYMLEDFESSLEAADQAVAIDPMLSEVSDEWVENLKAAMNIFEDVYDEELMSAS
ncbi:MAG: tetratricopeptide repeat protein [Promethearchaeota archaeon]